MRRAYAVLDVFTDTPLAGNPLAVVLDADGLDQRRMQAIAREFNLSETVFVLPPERSVHSARLRIFTPARELPFAGHPTVGTVVLLALRDAGELGRGEEREAMLVLEEKIGPVRCGVVLRQGRGRATFDAPALPGEAPYAAQTEAIAGALGLSQAEIGFENHMPTLFSAGVPYYFVPIRDLAAIGKAAVQPALWGAAFPGDTAAYLYTRDTMTVGRQFHARMFAPGIGIAEDPATGSAVAAFAGVVHRFDAKPSGWHGIVIEQGFEMGRPSLITLEVEIEASQLRQVRIAGDAVVVAEGFIEVN